MRLAIVGSTTFIHDSSWGYAEACIRHAIEKHRPEVVISGGAAGIDSLAREVAGQYVLRAGTIRRDRLERSTAWESQLRVWEHLPENPRWEPDGYKARNIRIAEDCTHLLAIRCHASKTYGSGWTADYAEKIGRKVRRIIL